MTTYIPKNPIPILMDVNFNRFFVHKDGRPHSGHGSHGGHGGHGGHRGSERDRGDRDGGAPMSQLGEEDAVKGLGQMNQRNLKPAKKS